VRWWDVATTELRRTLEGPRQLIKCVNYSPDGRFFASGHADGSLRLWDPRSGATLEDYAHHRNTVYSIAFTRDASALLTASFDRTLASLRVT